MRSDMYQVLHETTRARPLGKASGVRRTLGEIDGELGAEEPSRQSMRRPHRCRNDKETTLRLAPLRRFLRSRIGQPWDQVFAEMQSALKKRDVAFHSLLDYLSVATKTSLVNGEVVVHDPSLGLQPPESARSDFYVHPVTRALMCAYREEARAKRRKALKEQHELRVQASRRPLDESHQAHWVNGAWFEVTLGRLVVASYDVLLGRTVDASDAYELRERYGKATVYAQTKRQMSRRELKVHGLWPFRAN